MPVEITDVCVSLETKIDKINIRKNRPNKEITERNRTVKDGK